MIKIDREREILYWLKALWYQSLLISGHFTIIIIINIQGCRSTPPDCLQTSQYQIPRQCLNLRIALSVVMILLNS